MGGMRTALLVLSGLVLASCTESDAPDDETNPARSPEISRLLPAEEALAGAHIPTIDPMTMNDAEIAKGLGAGSHCEFRYTSSGKPVLALRNAPMVEAGVVKLNGSLIQLKPVIETNDTSSSTLMMTAGPVRASLTPLAANRLDGRAGERREVNLVFEVDTRLKVGYRGYFDCSAARGGAARQ